MNTEQPQWMKDHDASDTKRFNEHTERFDEQDKKIASLATKEDLKGLATEASVREIVHIYRNFTMAGQLLEGGSKWSFRAILAIAALVGALTVIGGGWKALVAWALSKI